MGTILRRLAPVVTAVMLASVGEASGATITVGQNVSANEQCGSGAILFQTAVSSGASYTVPSGNWTITSWSADGNVWGGQGSLVLIRPTAIPGSFDVVATSAAESFVTGQLNTFSATIPAQGGDIIGLWAGPNAPGTACAMGIPSATDTFSLAPLSTQPAVGTTLMNLTNAAFARVNISATLVSQPTLPTSKSDCKNGGWQSFPGFKNQGDCVSFVATGGKNPPSGS